MPPPNHSIFTDQMLFVMPSQQHQSTDGSRMLTCWIVNTIFMPQSQVWTTTCLDHSLVTIQSVGVVTSVDQTIDWLRLSALHSYPKISPRSSMVRWQTANRCWCSGHALTAWCHPVAPVMPCTAPEHRKITAVACWAARIAFGSLVTARHYWADSNQLLLRW